MIYAMTAQAAKKFRALVESLPRTKSTILCVESGGRVSKGALAMHLRTKALRRERRRYPTITLDLAGIL